MGLTVEGACEKVTGLDETGTCVEETGFCVVVGASLKGG